jgi:hypothetical protein
MLTLIFIIIAMPLAFYGILKLQDSDRKDDEE